MDAAAFPGRSPSDPLCFILRVYETDSVDQAIVAPMVDSACRLSLTGLGRAEDIGHTDA